MIVNSSAEKWNRGRPRTYKVNGLVPVPPSGGWKSASSDTSHGRVLVRLIESGEVQPTAKPHKVWNKYSELQIVQPAVFPKLFRRCIETANAPNNSIVTNNPTTPPATLSISSQQTGLGNMSYDPFDSDSSASQARIVRYCVACVGLCISWSMYTNTTIISLMHQVPPVRLCPFRSKRFKIKTSG